MFLFAFMATHCTSSVMSPNKEFFILIIICIILCLFYCTGLDDDPVRCFSCFQFLGLDFMVSQNWKVWFIEANNYPLWPRGTPEINEMIDTMGVRNCLRISL